MEEFDRITVSPHWEWWLIFYFFLGGIAAGAYFMAGLIELIGTRRDRELAKVSYYIGLPLILVCTVLLVLDLGRPERFWHMMLQSKTFLPMFKYWSPMSYGSWILAVFGGLATVSFVEVLAEDGRFGLGRLRGLTRYLRSGPISVAFNVLKIIAGFLLGSYTGALLTATNQPFWSDSQWLAALFMASAASTGIATMILLRRRSVAHESVERLDQVDAWAIGLELVTLTVFLISLGSLALPLIASPYGVILLVGTVLVGLLVPLALHFAPRLLGSRSSVVAASLVLVGGFVLRYSVLMAAQHIEVAGR